MTPSLARLRQSVPVRALAVLASLQLALGGFVRPALALTSGPSAPEFATFTPADTSQMVQPYTGDLSYNLPLMTVPGPNGGFPINLGYSSDLRMEEEASWVGFGWNLNVGAITRQLNQFADDWDGDTADCEKASGDRVEQIQYLQPSWTLGLVVGISSEIAGMPEGIDTLSGEQELYFNNQRGPGLRVKVAFPDLGFKFAGLGLSWDTQGGASVEPDFHLPTEMNAISGQVGFNINGRQGLQSMSFGAGARVPGTTDRLGNSLGVPASSAVQGVTIPTSGSSLGATFQYGKQTKGVDSDFKPTTTGFGGTVSVHYEQTTVLDDGASCTPVYGFLHLEGAGPTDLRDFAQGGSRWSKDLPALTPSRVTYDSYAVTGPGMVGSFRPFRSEFATAAAPRRTSEDSNDAFSADLAISTESNHAGVGYRWGSGEVSSGPWQTGDAMSGTLRYQGIDEENPALEPWWFRMVDEPTAADPALDPLATWHGLEALRPSLEPDAGAGTWKIGTKFEGSDAETLAVDASKSDLLSRRQTRERRGTTVQALSFEQACKLGIGKGARFYDAEDGGAEVGACDAVAHPHHIGAFIMHSPNGSRYVYALSAYNTKQIDRTWRVGEPDTDGIGYDTTYAQKHSAIWNVSRIDPESWEGEKSGSFDGYLQQTSLPPYVYAWLLTDVLPADYIDRTEDGISDDDAGSWVHIDYTRVARDYRWRTPYTGASFMAGSPNQDDDGLAAYSFGEREVYAVAKITTPTHVALFDTSAREDGLEAPMEQASEDAGMPTDALRAQVRLDRIRLFARASDLNGDPLQTVHLDYIDSKHEGYELGRNVPNHHDYDYKEADATHRGKLTLRRVYFTWQGSERGELSPYAFDYGDEEEGEADYDIDNPPYDPRRLDRWGQVRCLGTSGEEQNHPHALSPYTWQGPARVGCEREPETLARAWRLKRVIQPTGGVLHVAYEPDDYSLVERERPMAMLDVVGLGSWKPASDRKNATDDATIAELGTATASDLRVYFRLVEPVPSGTADAEAYIEDRYLSELDTVQYRAFAHLGTEGMSSAGDPAEDDWDFVSGYAPIRRCAGCEGVTGTNGDATVGFFTLQTEKISENSILPGLHPIQLAAIRHLQFNRPDLLDFPTPGDIETTADIKDVAIEALSSFAGIYTLLYGFVPVSLTDGRGRHVRLDGWTTVRLHTPDAKRGGGARVRRICMQESANEDDPLCTDTLKGITAYGQEYSYTLEDGTSSGVAYEPAIGREESSLVQPIQYKDGGLFRAPQSLFLEEPLLDAFYPGPSVGYRRVVVQSLARAEAESTGMSLRDAAPVTVHEFYSPATFPVRTDDTLITADYDLYDFSTDLITIDFSREAARSQGYTVVLNDMAGKPWRTTTLVPQVAGVSAEKVLSRTEYLYRTEAPFNADGPNRLSSQVLVRDGDGTLEEATVGQVYDMFTALHEDAQHRTSTTIDGNLGMSSSYAPLYLLILPAESTLDLSIKTAQTTKVIHQSGLLSEIRTFNGQGTAVATHIAFDRDSGKPVVIRTTNEWDDYLCTYDDPAWWSYPRMGGAWQNLGLTLEGTGPKAGGLGVFTFSLDVSALLVPGDLVLVGEDTLAWVVTVSGKNALMIDQNGAWTLESSPVPSRMSSRRRLSPGSRRGSVSASACRATSAASRISMAVRAYVQLRCLRSLNVSRMTG